MRPQILALDEPLDSLDLRNQQGVSGVIRQISRETGAAVLLLAPDINPLLPAVSRVVYMAHGQVTGGTPEEGITTETLSRPYTTPPEMLRASDRPIVGLFLAGVFAAIGIQTLNLAAGHSRQSDIAVGAVFTASLALGFLFIFLATTEYAANVYNVLFGNVLGISDADVSIIAWSTLVLVGAFLLIARPLFFASIDPDVAAARGVPVRTLAFGYLVLLALEVAVAVQVVGVLLIFALLVTPAAIAQDVTTRSAVAAAVAVALALIFTWVGLAVGYFTPYPVGFFITTFAFGTYALVRSGRFVLDRVRRRHLASLARSRLGGEV